MAFCRELRAKFVEFACCNSFRQMLVLHHADHVQVFDGDEAWFSLQDGIDDLVRVVRADGEQPVVQLLNLQHILRDICKGCNKLVTSFLFLAFEFSRQTPLLTPNFPFQPPDGDRLVDVLEFRAIAEDSKVLEPKVNAERLAFGRGIFRDWHVNHNGHIKTIGFLRDNAAFHNRSCWQVAEFF